MASVLDIVVGTAVEVVIIGIAGGVLYRFWRGAAFLPQRKTLLPFNKGVVMEGDRVVKVIDPGTHWVGSRQLIVPVDVRPKPFQMPPRELLTYDRQGVRIRVQGEYKVSDPEEFVRGSSDGHAAFYLSVDREIAQAVGELNRAEILESRTSPADRIRERIEPRAAQLGITILHIEVSDLIPITWKQTASE